MTRRRPTERPPVPPDDLGAAQAHLWRALVDEHRGDVFAPTDGLILRSIVDVAGRITEVRTSIDAEGVSVTGSKGQPREHPLLNAEARLRTELTAHLRAWEQAWELR